LYGLNNNSAAAIIADEVALLATITTDITDGIRGLSTDNFSFAIIGNDSDETLSGTSSDDRIISGNGNDTINGLGGNDNITLGNGTDTIVLSGVTNTSNGSDSISTFQSADKYDLSEIFDGGSISNSNNGQISIATIEELANHETPIKLTNNQLYLAEVTNKDDIDSVADIVAALADENGVIDAIDIDLNSDVLLILGGSDDDKTHFIYGIRQDNSNLIQTPEVSLLATVSADLENGVQSFTTDNFIF